MTNSVLLLNTIIVIGILIFAVFSVYFENILSSIIALSGLGTFVALEFIILQAPDIAIAEAVIGALLSPVIFLVALKKVKGGDKL
ncbi:DUF4040 domain-containing protein [Caloramator sp. E03]|uniref:hydrogenase subunit MbhD domain-containing protein n=1 Tax=Caloramator sp. E03 TaxID=2576307 RepID=UPI001110C142|nr:hydrogenase subunit MbhD domain-containing protein [Caloramator sp. E03]QCX32602.1 DUF4040 domain-containing protein [Caloramator sp. E03]